MTKPHDNFLAEAIAPRHKHISYQDGFRFGIGFFIAQLLTALILAGLTWGIIILFHLH
jgi:hypothetical protein